MQVRRLGPLLIPAALLVNAMMLSCGGGSSSVAIATPNPPGARLLSITVCDGPPASPMFTPVPPVPCSGAVSDSLAQGDTIAFHAIGKRSGARKDITSAKTTLWTSDNPGVAQTVTSQPGVFVGIAQGCACIAASSGGISSNVVGLTVFASATPECTPCAALGPTPAASAADAWPDAGHAGVLQWTFNAYASILAPIVVGADGGVYFVSADGNLHALDAQGRERWRRPALAIADAAEPLDTVYIRGPDGALQALAADGAALWHLAGGGSGPLAAASDGGLYAVASGALFSVSRAGALNWRLATGQPASAIAPLADRGVIAGITGGRVAAISPAGAERWSFTPEGGFSGAIAIAGEAAYVGDSAGVLHAIAIDNGAELGRVVAESNAPIRSGPVIDEDGIIYFGSDHFYAIAADGTTVWRTDLVPGGEAVPVPLGDGRVFVAGADGMIASLEADGSYRWGARIEGPVRAAAAGPSGPIYVGGADGILYAIR